jgi:hypothetical protein
VCPGRYQSAMADPDPGDPEDFDVASERPDLAQIEAARLLANDARPALTERGFDDDQIRNWAATYVAEEGGTADVADFLEWIDARER